LWGGVWGLGGRDYPLNQNPLTLPSPRRGEG
jgi:hypothetical protein